MHMGTAVNGTALYTEQGLGEYTSNALITQIHALRMRSDDHGNWFDKID